MTRICQKVVLIIQENELAILQSPGYVFRDDEQGVFCQTSNMGFV